MDGIGSDFTAKVLKSVPLGSAVAVGTAAVFTLLFSALLTWGVPDGWLPFFSLFTVFAAAVSGGVTAGIKGKARGLLLGSFTGIGLFLIHLLLILFFGTLSPSVWFFLAAEMSGGTVGGILGVNLRR